MIELSAQERDDWFERQFGVSLGSTIVERRDGGYITQVRRSHSSVEYRSAHHVTPLPGGRSPREYERQLERLLAWCRETDRLTAEAG